jgi:hypothetical protein
MYDHEPQELKGSWVVIHDPDGGCSGSHKGTHRNTHRNTHKGAHGDNIKLDSNHRQPILRFLSLAAGWTGFGCGCSQERQGWIWLGLELGWIRFSHVWDYVSRGLATFGIGQG